MQRAQRRITKNAVRASLSAVASSLLVVCWLGACSAYDAQLLAPTHSSVEGILGAFADASVGAAGRPGAGAKSMVSPRSVVDGNGCDDDGECKSDHCQRNVCCEGGNCCRNSDDCKAGGTETVCTNQSVCQGARQSWACQDYRCMLIASEDDDTSCDRSVEASDCGLYVSVHCSGDRDQRTPKCETTCHQDQQCDPGAHCEAGECVIDRANGGSCERQEQCASGHCGSGVCCEKGDCCKQVSDCPEVYDTPAKCLSTTTCQGTRGQRSCVDFGCQSVLIDDDTACASSMHALTCGGFEDVFCAGGDNQNPPICPQTGCGVDADCDLDYHCVESNCQPDYPDGQACTAAAQCKSGHCDAGLCCASGECCTTDEDCMDTFVCTDPSQCVGYARDRRCNAASQCEDGELRFDSAGCVGQISRYCGAYRDVRCALLSVPVVWECGGSCVTNVECNFGYVCQEQSCISPFQ